MADLMATRELTARATLVCSNAPRARISSKRNYVQRAGIPFRTMNLVIGVFLVELCLVMSAAAKTPGVLSYYYYNGLWVREVMDTITSRNVFSETTKT
jgi:hypothetical protein